MVIRLYDSMSQDLQEFKPVHPGKVGIYLCGPTVQSAPHLGHLRSALVYDLWRRWFEYRGYRVLMVRNVTDIDDKILANAAAGGVEEWWQLAYRVEQEFQQAYRRLGVPAPDYEPRATGHIPQMIVLIQRLIDRGHAYVAEDGSGDVYFSAKSWPSYGKLTRQKLEDLVSEDAGDAPGSAAEVASSALRAKRDPQDFALWKGHKASEARTAAWPTPWGAGRPGWHIECSAMATHYLGSHFDIHGGGLDLRFPHHENELAQSEAAGDSFANYWLHNGLIQISGQKMSKSLGNSVFAADILADYRPEAVRYFLASAHYRSVLDLGENSLLEAETVVSRIQGFVARSLELFPQLRAEKLSEFKVPAEFASAMDEDLNIPIALAVLHERLKAGNIEISKISANSANSAKATDSDLTSSPEQTGSSQDSSLLEISKEVLAMLNVLGLADSLLPTSGSQQQLLPVVETLVQALITQRQQAREQKNFAVADQIRDQLTAAGIVIEDGANGARWRIEQ